MAGVHKLCLLTQFAALGGFKTRTAKGYRSRFDRPDAAHASRVIACNFGVARTISGPGDLFTLKAANRYCAVTIFADAAKQLFRFYSHPNASVLSSMPFSIGAGKRVHSWKREKRINFPEGAISSKPIVIASAVIK